MAVDWVDPARDELRSLLRRQAKRLANSPLVVDRDRTTSGRELDGLVDEKSSAYRKAGVGAGTLVGVLAGPPAAFISDLFAVIDTGATAVPLPHRLTEWELSRVGGLLPLTFLATSRDSPLAPDLPVARVEDRLVGRLAFDEHSAQVPANGMPWHLAATAQITSGTTGRPRAALRSAAALLAESANYQTALSLPSDHVMACAVPLHHAYGLGLCALAAPLAGVIVHHVSAERPRVLLRELASRGVTLFAGVPPMLRMIATAARAVPQTSRPIGFISAGMSLDVRTAELIGTRLGGLVGQVYGTTETGPICVLAPTEWPSGVRTLGVPLPGVEIGLTPLEDSPAGLLTVRSPSTMLGYADSVGVAALDGAFVTGDLGRWVDGELVLVGRRSTCINVAGTKVSPEEVEAVVLTFAQVSSCIAVGVPDQLLGQRIKVAVTPATVDVEELQRFCQSRLSPTQMPHLFTAVQQLATTATGKVMRGQAI